MLLADAAEPKERQRASLAHELAHVIYHPLAAVALPDLHDVTSDERLERACDYFAACLLMPRTWMKRAYFEDRIQDAMTLAGLFGVSVQAMCIRFAELGLPAERDCLKLEVA